MSQMLENKVSNLMATVKTLEKDIDHLNKDIKELNVDKVVLNENIEQLEDKIKQQRADYVDLQNECDDLKLKGGSLSPIAFDKLNSQINL